MPKFKTGNMLDSLHLCDYAFITTNSFVKRDGKLVMGRGIAQQVRDSYPGIDYDFGTRILKEKAFLKEYNLLHSRVHPKFYAFQVKYHWFSEADLKLIENSCKMLKLRAELEEHNIFFLNFPGIGNGKLSREDVLPLIEDLPDNVTIWEYEC